MAIEFLLPDWPAPSSVRALVTSRIGGVSRGAYASLNLAAHVGDDPAAVAENRRRLRAYLPNEPLWLAQEHGATVVDAALAAPGAVADASFSRRTGVVCAVLTADCLPVLLCDEQGTAVAAIHAGWRGLAAGVVEATIAALAMPPARLIAWLGPAIGPCCFIVGDDVRQSFLERDPEAAAAFLAAKNGKWQADLYHLARRRLAAQGLSRIHGGGLCTACEARRFYSYRREGVTGRIASLIWLDTAD